MQPPILDKEKYIEYLSQPMTEGGAWLQPFGSDIPAIYVTHEAHIRRLFVDGWQQVTDPRPMRITEIAEQIASEHQAKAEKQQTLEQENFDLRQKLAGFEAFLARQSTPESDDATDVTKRARRGKQPE